MSQLTADLLLLLVTLAWGSTFVIVKDAISQMGPLTFLAVRFFIAGMVLLIWHLVQGMVVRRRGRLASDGVGAAASSGIGSRTGGSPGLAASPAGGEGTAGRASREFIVGSLLTGLALFFSYVTQTLGLMTVTAGKAAFITGLYIVFVPVASRALLRTVPDRASVVGVALATIGLGLMSLKLPIEIASGDFLVFLCAIGFTAQILLVDRYATSGPTLLFTAIQLLVTSLGSAIGALLVERPLAVPAGAWGAILFTAIAATSLAFLIQMTVQRYTTATHTALVFSAEPVFGALFAWIMAHEMLSGREIAGGVCILAGMLVAESSAFRRRGEDSADEPEPSNAGG